MHVLCNVPFLMLCEEHEMANQSGPKGEGGVKQHSSRVKHFLKGVKINLGGLTP